jgi:Uncharacterised nucleotidyltransferase
VSVAAAVAAFGLPSRHLLPTEPLAEQEFRLLLTRCEQHRLLGLLAKAVRTGSFPLDDEQHEALEAMVLGWVTHALRVERLVLDATAALDRVGIESRVLKGVALAHTAYDDPADRVFGDIDLLVPSGDFSRAVLALEDRFGATRAQPEIRPGFDDRFGKEAMIKVGAVELDVHRIFVEGALGLTIQTDDLFAPPYRFPLGTTELEALPMPPRLLHAAYAAALGDWPPRLMSLRDAAQIVLRERPHPADVLMMARSWRCEVVLARALTTAWTELALTDRPPLVEWAFRYRPGRMDRVLLASHLGPARAFTRHAAAVVVLPGAGARLAYLRAIATPQRSYLEARGLTVGSNAQRALRRLFR